MATAVRLLADTYVDSVVQLRAMRAMGETDGVEWASAGMATPANVDDLKAQGIERVEVAEARSGDFFLAVRAQDDHAAALALSAGEAAVSTADQSEIPTDGARTSPTLWQAMHAQPRSNVAVVSVPGEYAALAAHEALSAGLHVLLFSDNVTVEKEVVLKDHALTRGRLMMGPGAGTAMLGGIGLGFANVVSRGRVGVVAAAGTGAQEVMCLLDRWGAGVSQVIGVGGRDLTAEVGGRMARAAVAALGSDPATDAILVVSKPADPDVAANVLGAGGDKPVVAALIGRDPASPAPPGVVLTDTLDSGAAATLRLLGTTAPDMTVTWGPTVTEAIGRLTPDRTVIRGLFSGGTLCYESQVVLSRIVGAVHSNTPINADWGLPPPSGAHVCLDLGEEEYTKGRPHPMIDPLSRIDLIQTQAADPQVAVLLLDVVLGHGAHPDPAGVLAPVCESAMAGGGPQVVAYVLGTDRDPQVLTDQRERLVGAGCIVAETAARASLIAAGIAMRDPGVLGAPL